MSCNMSCNMSVASWHNSSFEVNDTDYGDSGNMFILPLWKQMLWTFLYATMVFVATGGNLIVIWIVLAHKRMRTVTNYFLVNLSIADAMVSTLNVTFNYIYMLNSDWPFGTLYCKITQFVAVLSICASVFTLMAISIDRYMAIMHPLRPRMGRRTTLCIAGAIWVVGTVLSLPMLIFFTTVVQDFPNGDSRVVCYSEWPDGATNESYQEYLYNVFFMVLTYFLPISSMSFTYIRVGIELWGSQSIGECTQRQLENIKSKRRVQRVLYGADLLFAYLVDELHLHSGRHRAVGQSEHRRVHAETTGEHQVEKKDTYCMSCHSYGGHPPILFFMKLFCLVSYQNILLSLRFVPPTPPPPPLFHLAISVPSSLTRGNRTKPSVAVTTAHRTFCTVAQLYGPKRELDRRMAADAGHCGFYSE
ncbi:hypothetical protein LSTR_LSTR011669 [Laodelphax striatellus]|uniref:G-protein coupled receptors family 1 profile domain-containing protein n=1 Tax=Laodelphax striatellus TaxID=195883 RepID=A0A482WNY5_LAOST|nr:hypothetical protein LSTR_LSTR011669 [Laodelphax striatellus]